ncbi:MAG: HEAT repeat domain-containing protein [Phycisphaerae bacterium]|nr:HEAT repeat domain-containing protein [Phycisphaerae bacterium]
MRREKNIIVILAMTGVMLLHGCTEGWPNVWNEQAAPAVSPDRAYVDARTVILQAANDIDPFVRTHAMEAIGKVLTSREAGMLLSGLDDRYATVRFAATMALGELGYTPAKARLKALVEDRQTDERVVCGAIYALFRMGDTTYAGQLGAILTSDFALGRSTAAMIMGKMGEKSAIGPLKALQADENDPNVRLTIVEALARLGEKHSISILESYAKGYFLDLRLPAIPLIAEIRAPRGQIVLKSLLKTGNPPRVRVAAAGGLGILGIKNETAYSVCAMAARHPETVMRSAYGKKHPLKPAEISSLQQLAAISLGQIKHPDSIGVLMPMLQSADGAVRVAAAMGILQMQAPEARPVKTVSDWTPKGKGPVRPMPKLHTSGGMD